MDGFYTFYTILGGFMLIGGVILAARGLRRIRRGPVTAREAVEWRHHVRKQGLDAQEGMRPAITDALVIAWWRSGTGSYLGGGIGLAIAGIAYLVFLFVRTPPGFPIPDYNVALCLVSSGLVLSLAVGRFLGVRSVVRTPTDMSAETPRRIRDYRSWVLPAYLVFVILAMSVFSGVVVSQLLATGEGVRAYISSPRPSIFPFIAAPIWLILLLIIMEFLVRRIAVLPPLHTPLESPFARTADDKLKALTIGFIYTEIGFLIVLTGLSLSYYAGWSYLDETISNFNLAFNLFTLVTYVLWFSFFVCALVLFLRWRCKRPARRSAHWLVMAPTRGTATWPTRDELIDAAKAFVQRTRESTQFSCDPKRG